jgi:hypothetical protein
MEDSGLGYTANEPRLLARFLQSSWFFGSSHRFLEEP